ncbi:hypothetical protein RR46_09037 [Papilio xuthus]|nr:hypothetical protein RR46_09037 [Papilio xuthus]
MTTAIALVVALLCLAEHARGTVSCRTACAQCAARTEHQALLEVYCAMCHECRERRRAWRHFAPRRRKSPNLKPNHRANSADEFPDESPDGPPGGPPEGPPEEPRCPEPPPCDSEQLDGPPDMLMPTTPEQGPPASLPPAPFPAPAQPSAGPAPCCLPMCPYAQPYAPPCTADNSPQKMTLPEPTTAAPTEYFYIHVGVPKDIINNM